MQYRVGLMVAAAMSIAGCASAEGSGGAGELDPGTSSDNADAWEAVGESQQALTPSTQWYELRLNARQGQTTVARALEGATFTLTSTGTAATFTLQGPGGSSYWYNVASVWLDSGCAGGSGGVSNMKAVAGNTLSYTIPCWKGGLAQVILTTPTTNAPYRTSNTISTPTPRGGVELSNIQQGTSAVYVPFGMLATELYKVGNADWTRTTYEHYAQTPNEVKIGAQMFCEDDASARVEWQGSLGLASKKVESGTCATGRWKTWSWLSFVQ